MKNKSKLKKIREKKAGTATVTKEWLYMNPNSITVAEIENALEGMDGIETEIWKEAECWKWRVRSIIPWISRRLQSI